MTQPKHDPKTEDDFVEELDAIQRDIWARINDELQKEGIKYTIGTAYSVGSIIKEVLHPRVRNLLQKHKHHLKTQFESLVPEELDIDSVHTYGGWGEGSQGAKHYAGGEINGHNKCRQQILNKLKEL